MEQTNLDRINELYNKSKSLGLSPEEKQEQAKLREDYIKAIRKNLRGTLENISFVEADGSISKAKRKSKDS